MNKKLRVLRVIKGLTQQQLAERTKTSQQIISLIETGQLEPKGRLKGSIAKVLKAKSKDFIKEN